MSQRASQSQRGSQSQRAPQSQRGSQSQTVSQSQPVAVTRAQAIKFVKYVLNNTSNKIPMKRTDFVANVLSGNTKMFQSCYDQAQEILQEIYGSKLVPVPNKTPIQYICVSTLESVSELEYTPAQRKDITFLFLVLSFLFMKGGSTSEETIKSYLKHLSIPFEEPPHEYFGNVKKLLTETLPKQQYLHRDKRVIDGNKEEEITVSWGFRSIAEFPKDKVLNLVAEILQKPAVCFGQQYDEVYGGENVEMD